MSDADLVQLAVARGWITPAVAAQDTPARTLLETHLTPAQLRELEGDATVPLAKPSTSASLTRVGHYVMDRHLKSGGMGVVYKAWDSKLSRWVAVKLLKAIGDDTARAYFEREAQLAAKLAHPNIAAIYEVGEHEGLPFIAMQFIDGRNLWEARRELSRDEAIRAVIDAARAVHAAHREGIIHRDLKPANLMIDRDGRVFVLDFGLAKQTNVQGGLSASNVVLGTPAYMAPEQARGKSSEIDSVTDVYGLGACLYELLTGRPPFVSENQADILLQIIGDDPIAPRKLVKDMPEDLETIALKCLEKNKARRYPSAAALADDLERWRRGDAIEAHPPSVAYRIGKRVRKQPIAWALGLALVAAAGFGMYGLIQAAREGKQKAAALEESRAKVLFRQGIFLKEQKRFQAAAAYFLKSGTEEAWAHYQFTAPDCPRLAQVLSENRGSVKDLAMSDDLIAIGYADGTVTIAGRVLGKFPVSERGPRLSMKGRLVAIGHSNGLSVFRDGKELWASQEIGGIQAVAISPDGKLLAGGSSGSAVHLWDAESGRKEERSLTSRGMSVTSLGFSGDGRRLAASYLGQIPGPEQTVMSGVFCIWDIPSRQEVGGRGRDPNSTGVAVALNADGQVMVAGAGKAVYVWAGGVKSEARSLEGIRQPVTHLSLSPDGRSVAVCLTNKAVGLWNIGDGAILQWIEGHSAFASVVKFSADGTKLATGSYDGTVRLYDLATRTEKVSGVFSAVHFQGGEFWTNSGKKVQLWKSEDGSPVADLPVSIETVRDLVGSDQFILTATQGAVLQFWDRASGRELFKTQPHEQNLRQVLLTPDGSVALTCGAGPQVKMWDVSRRRELASLEGGKENLNFIALSADGSTVAGTTWDPAVYVWDRATGKVRMKLPGTAHAVALERSGSRIAIGWTDATQSSSVGFPVEIYDVNSGKRLNVLEGNNGYSTRLAFSPDGKRLISVNGDYTLSAWDLSNSTELLRMAWNHFGSEGLHVSEDGSRAVVVSSLQAHWVRLFDPELRPDRPVNTGLRVEEDGSLAPTR